MDEVMSTRSLCGDRTYGVSLAVLKQHEKSQKGDEVPTRVAVKPELLKWAVERGGGWDAVSTTRVNTLDLWIEGTRNPTLRKLEDSARATHAPFAALFLDTPPVEETPIPDFRTLPSLTSQNPSANLLDTIYLAQRRQESYRAYAYENESEPVAAVGSATINQPIDSVAAFVRLSLDFAVDNRRHFSNPVAVRKHLVEKLEDQGILVMISGIVGAISITLKPFV